MKKMLLIAAAAVLLVGCNQATPQPKVSVPSVQPTSEVTAPTEGAMVKPVTIDLDEQNKSGQKGTVEFKEENGKTMVTIDLSGSVSAVPEPAHIHMGQCPNPGEVKYPLTNVVAGKSVTTLDMDLATLWKDASNLAVNVHKSANELKSYVACGDLM